MNEWATIVEEWSVKAGRKRHFAVKMSSRKARSALTKRWLALHDQGLAADAISNDLADATFSAFVEPIWGCCDRFILYGADPAAFDVGSDHPGVHQHELGWEIIRGGSERCSFWRLDLNRKATAAPWGLLFFVTLTDDTRDRVRAVLRRAWNPAVYSNPDAESPEVTKYAWRIARRNVLAVRYVPESQQRIEIMGSRAEVTEFCRFALEEGNNDSGVERLG
jgi:hypothetical protein